MAIKPLVNINQGYATGGSNSASSSVSNTYGTAATQMAQSNAATANNTAMAAWREAAQYNAEQARIQREWEERMANTVYQRSVADMKAAGINPILAAGMGLGSASVGSGATASMGNPSTYMSNTFADQNSASTSSGRSWSESESGLGTFLTGLGTIVDGMIAGLNASRTIKVVSEGLKEMSEKDPTNTIKDTVKGTKYEDYVNLILGNHEKEVKDHPTLRKISNFQYNLLHD